MSDEVRQVWSPAVKRLAGLVLVVWALGTVFGEALTQVGLYATLAVALFVGPRAKLPTDVSRYVKAAMAYAGWQALSPLLALVNDSALPWPTSLRYGQFVDTLAAAAGAVVAQVWVPWAPLLLTLALGWSASVWVGVYQHLHEWTLGRPPWVPESVEARIHENFAIDGPPRFGAGGFLFHRLRFSHGSIALLGPALAAALWHSRWRWFAAALVLELLAAPYLGFARAAFGVGLLMLAVVSLSRPRAFLALAVAGGIGLGLVASNESWRKRIADGVTNVSSGEREVARTAGWTLVQQHPLVGVGFGNHKPAALRTQAETGVTELLATDSHAILLTIWAETGLLGLVLFALMHGLWLKAVWPRVRNREWFAIGGLVSWVGHQVLGLVHYLPYHTGVHLTFSLVWALALAPQKAVTAPSKSLPV